MNIIVAKDEMSGIGLDNSLPWKCKGDLKRFSMLTRGNGNNAVLMGKNTWNSLPSKPLLGRENLIISQATFEFSAVDQLHYVDHYKNSDGTIMGNTNKISFFKNIDVALDYIEQKQYDEVWIIGGEKVYDAFLNIPKYNNRIEHLYITEIIGNYNCDTFFNIQNIEQYKEISSEPCGDNAVFKVYKNSLYKLE